MGTSLSSILKKKKVLENNDDMLGCLVWSKAARTIKQVKKERITSCKAASMN